MASAVDNVCGRTGRLRRRRRWRKRGFALHCCGVWLLSGGEGDRTGVRQKASCALEPMMASAYPAPNPGSKLDWTLCTVLVTISLSRSLAVGGPAIQFLPAGACTTQTQSIHTRQALKSTCSNLVDKERRLRCDQRMRLILASPIARARRVCLQPSAPIMSTAVASGPCRSSSICMLLSQCSHAAPVESQTG
eukprot:6210888-Pleurochrysis_carterae.AAC.2